MKTHAQGEDKGRNIYKAVTKLENCGKPGHVVNLNQLYDLMRRPRYFYDYFEFL